jgi:hypothetical protein
MSRTSTWVLAAFVVAVVSCGGGDAPPETSRAGAKPPPPAKTADQAVERVVHGLADGKPEVMWHALPAGYRRDLTELIHTGAATVDAELWDGTFRVLGKLTRVMSDKREFILSHPMVAAQLTNPREAYKSWDAVVGIFDTIVRSELADLGSMKELDVERFLAETGAEVMRKIAEASALTAEDEWAAAMANLRATKATVVSGSGDQAVVRIEAPDAPIKEEPFIRVEGCWVPQRMAAGWSGGMEAARSQLAKYSQESSVESRQAARMQLAMIESAIDSVLAAGSAQEFNASLGAILGVAMSAAARNSSITLETSAPELPHAAAPPAPEPANARPSFDASAAPESPGAPGEQEVTASAPAAVPSRGAVPASFDVDEIPIHQASQYVGQTLRVEGRNGLDVMGELVSIKGGVLRFEKRLRSGSAWFEIDRDEIRTIRLVH